MFHYMINFNKYMYDFNIKNWIFKIYFVILKYEYNMYIIYTYYNICIHIYTYIEYLYIYIWKSISFNLIILY
jgi:hypothetical protein